MGKGFSFKIFGRAAEKNEMSEQLEFLKNLIASAQTGREGAITLLRQICETAVQDAPPHALITVAQCLYHIGVEASRAESGRN
jgi:hypothetical protein